MGHHRAEVFFCVLIQTCWISMAMEYPLLTNIAMEASEAMAIVDLPMKMGDFPSLRYENW
jgi:hypothetical protein